MPPLSDCQRKHEITIQVDLFIANLECVLSNSERCIEKVGPHLKAPPEAVETFLALGVDLVMLANNHILDYG
ncbi:MAG TPA: hypothetical protein ENF20_04155 [Candidatus Marinimicrobia bacterium]|nr:hypothetical protein [Candidatus Neomarinimicrobiota bacterium]